MEEEKWQLNLQVSKRNKDIDTIKEYALCYTTSRQGFVPCTQGWMEPSMVIMDLQVPAPPDTPNHVGTGNSSG